jgi:hypothetical protein
MSQAGLVGRLVRFPAVGEVLSKFLDLHPRAVPGCALLISGRIFQSR